MAIRTEMVALILVESQIELGTMLHHRTIERRQEHMVLVVNLRYRHYQQTVVLARIAVNKR